MSDKPIKLLAENVHKAYGRNEVLRGIEAPTSLSCGTRPRDGGAPSACTPFACNIPNSRAV